MKLGWGAYSEFVRRLTNAPQGEWGPAEVSDEFAVAFVVESDRPEWAYLRGERLCSGTATQVSSIITSPYVQLFNPFDSNVLVVLHKAHALSDSLQVQAYIGDFIGGGIEVSARVRDSRLDQNPAAQIRRGTSAPGVLNELGKLHLVGMDMRPSPAMGSYVWDQPVVLTPGWGFTLEGLGVNDTLIATFHWSERALRPLEQ
jgi:hypothetical protein